MPQPDLQQQVAELTATIRRLSERVAKLEGQTATTPVTNFLPTTLPNPQRSGTRSVPVNPAARWVSGIVSFFLLLLGGISPVLIVVGLIGILVTMVWPWKKRVSVHTSDDGRAVTTPAAAVTHPRQPSRFEQDLARHWFSWLGIISLVVGITLLLNYAFRGYGPLGRVMTGYAVGGMLFGLWFWLRRVYQGFAFVLQSGGWALVYISTYALHTVGNHPIQSPLTAGYALLVVVAAMCISALLQRSKALTVGAFFLGYITALTNSLDLFTLISLLGLSVGIILVALALRWPELIFAGTVATYLVQMLWMIAQPDYQSVAGTAAGLLVCEALIFGAAHWMMNSETAWRKQFTTFGSIVNLLGFYWLFHLLVNLSNNERSWLATLFISIVCGVLAGTTSVVKNRAFLRPTYSIFTVGFLTLALSQKLQGDSLTLAFLIESTAIVSLGTWMRDRTLRYSGYAVSFIAALFVANTFAQGSTFFGSTRVHSQLVLGLFAAACASCSATLLKIRQALLPSNERLSASMFADLALVFVLLVSHQELPSAWVPVIWSAVSIALIGLAYRSINGRGAGYTIAVLSILYWVVSVMGAREFAGPLHIHAQFLSGLWLAGALGLIALLLHGFQSKLPKSEQAFSATFAWGAILVLTVVFGSEIAPRVLSVVWGIEGVALFVLGFAAQNAHARRQGIAVLGLTIAKVYVIDVQTLATPYKILSFIILGCILLAVGFLYNRWRQRSKIS